MSLPVCSCPESGTTFGCRHVQSWRNLPGITPSGLVPTYSMGPMINFNVLQVSVQCAGCGLTVELPATEPGYVSIEPVTGWEMVGGLTICPTCLTDFKAWLVEKRIAPK